MATVTIRAGQNIQQVINAHPIGSTYRLLAGVHRLQPFQPRTGDKFEGVLSSGRRMTILSGARVLSNWTREKGRWSTPGQTPHGEVVTGPDVCQASYPRCDRPEDLFMDDVLKRHVATPQEVAPGAWHYDYAANRIIVGDNPHGKLVECSVLPNILGGALTHPASTVGFEDLIIEKYASPSSTGAIQLGNSQIGATGWTIDRCEVRWNHAVGVNNDALSVVRDCYIHHNGQFGLHGAGWDILVEGNEIAHNNTNGYNYYWGAGGSKWVWTTKLTVRGNFSHHNGGPGLWTDINNLDTVYEYNTVEDNYGDGISHEISYDAIIRHNVCRRNGTERAWPGYVSGAGICVANSRNVEVHDNVCDDNWQAICGKAEDRHGTVGDPNNPHGLWELVNLHVHDNRVVLGDAYPDGGSYVGIASHEGMIPFQPAANNRYAQNDYVGDPMLSRFKWNEQDQPFAAWQSAGQDVTGSCAP